jgi:predicted nucleic acid-binding protein
LLDTDVLSCLLDRRPEALEFRAAMEGKVQCTSFVTVAELLFGAFRRNWGPARLAPLWNALARLEVLHSTDEVVLAHARLVADCEALGHPLGAKKHRADAWIAAICITHDIPLLTRNTRHFVGTPSLVLADAGPPPP